MKKAALISDIHGNLEALEAVLQDIDNQGIEEVICLGDIVGYGPNPVECVDLVRPRCKITIRGNHDDALIHGAVGFTQLAREAIDWTRRCLKPRFWRMGSAERWRFLENLPLRAEWNGYLMVHGSPRDPTSEYIMDRDVLMGDPQKFAEIFDLVETVCFVGHTHIPGVFYSDSMRPRFVPQRDMPETFGYENAKMVVNVGSVGQPRDRDARACYLTVDTDDHVFAFRRLEYDWRKTRAKIYAISTLNNQLGDRLGEGM